MNKTFFAISFAFATHAFATSPFLEGYVKDEYGRPIKGATVYIADCLLTCWGSGAGRITDENGHYVFETKTFRNQPLLSASMPGRFLVSKDSKGPHLDAESNDPRQVNFVLGTPAAVSVTLKGKVPTGLTQSIVLRGSHDTELHQYNFEGVHNRGWGSWYFNSVPREKTLHVVLVEQPVVEHTDDPKEMRERERLSNAQRMEVISPAIHFLDSQHHEIQLNLHWDEETDLRWLSFQSVTDGIGNERTKELMSYDPRYGPPADQETQRQGRELLKRLADPARPWNASPPASIVTYEYDGIDTNGGRTHVIRTKDSPLGPGWSDIARVRGFAYMPPLRWLFKFPESVVFHEVTREGDRTILFYRLKEVRGFSVALGVGSAGSGFYNQSFSAGKIIVDHELGVVLEHRMSLRHLGAEAIETFSDFVPVGDGMAPAAMRIKAGDYDFRLRFKVHADCLWLLDDASLGEDTDPVFRIENVSVKLK